MMKMRKALAVAALAGMALLFTTSVAFAAAGTPADAGADNKYSAMKWIGLAVGLGMGIAAFGGAIGQSRAAAAALDGIARNPGASGKIFTPMILALALIESLVIYSLVISFILNGHINLGG